LIEQGQIKNGLIEMQDGIDAVQTHLLQSYYLTLLAQAYEKTNQLEEGLHILAEALVHVQNNGERCYEAEIYRFKGQLLLQQSANNQNEAEICFRQAIAIVQSQSAKSWELRAATSLAHLWSSQGKRQEAQALLGDVYGWFTEGFGTADLQDARALLDDLASS